MPIRQMTPREADKLVAFGYRDVDVRAEPEFAAGHPAGAVNIRIGFPDPATRQTSLTWAAEHSYSRLRRAVA